MMRSALVTGGAGFLGSHLCEELLARGWDVTCLDNFSTGRRENLAHLKNLEVIEADANRAETWQELEGRKFDVVVHYAACVGVLRTEKNPLAVLNDVAGMRHLARWVKAGGADKIVYASSSEVYGPAGAVPMREEDLPVAWSPYANVKAYGEYLFKALGQKYGIPAVSLRFFNVYGPRQAGSAYGFVVAKFVQQVLSGLAPTVFGDGGQTRDFVYVADNVAAAVAAIESTATDGQVVNIGTGRETAIIDLAYAVIKACGQAGRLEPVFLEGREVEVLRRQAATEKMEEVWGGKCGTDLAAGLKLMVGEKAVERNRAGTIPVQACG